MADDTAVGLPPAPDSLPSRPHALNPPTAPAATLTSAMASPISAPTDHYPSVEKCLLFRFTGSALTTVKDVFVKGGPVPMNLRKHIGEVFNEGFNRVFHRRRPFSAPEDRELPLDGQPGLVLWPKLNLKNDVWNFYVAFASSTMKQQTQGVTGSWFNSREIKGKKYCYWTITLWRHIEPETQPGSQLFLVLREEFFKLGIEYVGIVDRPKRTQMDTPDPQAPSSTEPSKNPNSIPLGSAGSRPYGTPVNHDVTNGLKRGREDLPVAPANRRSDSPPRSNINDRHSDHREDYNRPSELNRNSNGYRQADDFHLQNDSGLPPNKRRRVGSYNNGPSSQYSAQHPPTQPRFFAPNSNNPSNGNNNNRFQSQRYPREFKENERYQQESTRNDREPSNRISIHDLEPAPSASTFSNDSSPSVSGSQERLKKMLAMGDGDTPALPLKYRKIKG